MDNRRAFLKKAALLSGSAALANLLPASIQKAMAINPAAGSTYLDAEHIVILMQENRSFDHCFGTLQGVRGFNDPRAIRQPNGLPVWAQTDAAGDTYGPFRLDIKDTKITWMGSLPHSRASQVDAYNQGKYDQWLLAKKSGNKQYAHLPLTMGHYTREDLPFNYALADAFTVCDHNFCSAMTSTTPNRSFFWTGKITHEVDGQPKAHIRNDDFVFGTMPWQTFPELLEKEGIAWKFYQNDLSCGGGYTGAERSWLSNYGCNLLEFFKAYQVKFSDRYIRNLQKQAEDLPAEINTLQEKDPSDEERTRKIKAAIRTKQETLDNARLELSKWNRDSYAQLSAYEKSLYDRAFVINSADADFRSITQLTYHDGGEQRKATVPKGDLFHQFRADVNAGQLSTVSWLAGPQNFSDHPSAPWYGAWYVSEVLDILTKNPEVWKKTIFILTYDENDGYYDHLPPFSIPDNKISGTGKVSAGIETEVEHVRLANEVKQGVPQNQAREGAIGLGFRVPMIVASPWSRGGKVCSEVFDHTSTLQFIETFVNQKYHKNIRLENISEWRRTICGNLTSIFNPFDGSPLATLPFLDRNQKVEAIFNAQFKQLPNNFNKLSDAEIAQWNTGTGSPGLQEKGTRTACPLPYELHAQGGLTPDGKNFRINFASGTKSGAPFTAYVPVSYKDDSKEAVICRNWSFAVKAGDQLHYQWPLDAFENGACHLRVHGPNGFYREFKGKGTPLLVTAHYLNGNLVLDIENTGKQDQAFNITDHSYGAKTITKTLAPNSKLSQTIELTKNFNWYDVSITASGHPDFEQRLAGHVETGAASKTDPLMGGMV